MTTQQEGTDGNQLRRLIRWNRFWLTLLSLVALAAGFMLVIDPVHSQLNSVRAGWRGDTLYFQCEGPLLLTHLVGESDGLVAAELAHPIFVLDSGGARIERLSFDALVWRYEGGAKAPAPRSGSRVRGLYIRLQASDWNRNAWGD